ncbi:hypothetical protein HZA44_00450, partial [Candidatus Peregrinibacteria bacterium]|nr:hypothetical protein [Candidatus Peregrinibacteria bacterium]
MKNSHHKIKPYIYFLSILIAITGFFGTYYYFGLFGKKIDYKADILPMSLGIAFLVFGLSVVGGIKDGSKGAIKYFIWSSALF